MEERILTAGELSDFRQYLLENEKSPATIEKYLRDARSFLCFANNNPVTKELVLSYKKWLMENHYAARSVNSMLTAVNTLLAFLGWSGCRVKIIRTQRQTYSPEERELTKAEYCRLLDASRNDTKLNRILQTICGTGIRVSELKYFTVESVRQGEITVHCKSKIRSILIPRKLRALLLDYAKQAKISGGCIFRNTKGRPLDRSTIWAQMKRLCAAAKVNPGKVFPHNLRKLFARTFYRVERDIAKLADILGHSSINTTRIYIMTTGTEHRRKMERLGLVISPGEKRHYII